MNYTMKIIIDDGSDKMPMFFITKDKDLVDSLLFILSMYGIERIIPDAAILAYRKEKGNHFHFSSIDRVEMCDFINEVVDAIIEETTK